MIIHPDVRALRGDDTPQRIAQDQLAGCDVAWREGPESQVLAELAAFDTARPIAECPALSALFEDGDPAAGEFASSFVDAMLAALGAHPLGHVPVRHFTDGVLSTLMLARAGNVTLSLVAIDGAGLASRPAPQTADFGPRECWEHVLAGCGEAELVECRSVDADRADLRRRRIVLEPGKVVCRDGERQALLVTSAIGCLVSLRLQRRRAGAGVTREYALDDGRLVHRAAGNPRDSRVELMLALMGRMERADAAPHAAAIARGEGCDALRWQALRECLGLDTLTGFRALAGIAGTKGDPFSSHAEALRVQLLDTYPQLAGIEPCPA